MNVALSGFSATRLTQTPTSPPGLQVMGRNKHAPHRNKPTFWVEETAHSLSTGHLRGLLTQGLLLPPTSSDHLLMGVFLQLCSSLQLNPKTKEGPPFFWTTVAA